MATPNRKGRRSDGAQFRVPFSPPTISAKQTGERLQRRGHTFEQRLVAPLHSRRGSSSSTVAAGAMLVPKLAVMAWYRVDLNGRCSLRRVKGFSRMPCKSGSSDAQSEESQCQQVTRAVSLLYRRGAAHLLRAMQASEDTAAATIRRSTANPGCSCWLLFAVSPPLCSKKTGISVADPGSFAVSSVHISENSGGFGAAASCVDTAGAGRSCCGALEHCQPTRDSHD
jgi:hypothetical protein